MSEKNQISLENLRMQNDKEVQDAITAFTKVMDAKGYDYLLCIGDRITREKLRSGVNPEGMSAINFESEVPVLPSILFGLCQKSKLHERFVTEFLHMMLSMGREIVSKVGKVFTRDNEPLAN